MNNKYLACFLAAALAAPGQVITPNIPLVEVLWGWADLHAHPASHLGFGADANGESGIFWGKPGKKMPDGWTTLYTDLPACSFKHGGADGDLVRHETHKGLMQQLDSVTEHPHQTADFGENNFGSPDFRHWPHARSVTHQQMHITAIRRAYDGGQRLMVASVTDNEFLHDMWAKVGYNANGAPVPKIDPQFGYDSALRQIKHIKQMAKDNAQWMQIVESAAQARAIIRADKMAIILSLEMDSLTPQQVLLLVKNEGVRHVIPIHLINNQMGGPAVYSDAFNAVNNFVNSSRDDDGDLLNNGFFKVIYDPLISFRLGRPSYIRPEGNNIVQGGAMHIDPVPIATYMTLGYDNPGAIGGHRNSLGLTDLGRGLFTALAQLGVLMDVAHMSEKATADTLAMAERLNYPVMDSHTGLRAADETAFSERDLARKHATKIGELGGVIGMGTEGVRGIKVLLPNQWSGIQFVPLERFKGPEVRTWNLPTLPGDPFISHLIVRTKTGTKSLKGGGLDVFAQYRIDGKAYQHRLNQHQEGWRPGLVVNTYIELPEQTPSSKLTQITIAALNPGIEWDLDELEIRAVPNPGDTVSTWLADVMDLKNVMNNKGGIAIGTDINGFAPQMAVAAEEVVYPIDVMRKYGRPNANPLPKSQMGSRAFNFKNDGIAHYGMLPDLLQAVSQKPGSDKALRSLFSSANSVVLMWDRCEKAAKALK